MAKYKLLYNPIAGNKKGKEEAEKIHDVMKEDSVELIDITTVNDLNGFFGSLPEDTKAIVAGGDGTLNRFINSVDEEVIRKNDIYYFAIGTGNDFLFDIGGNKGDAPILLNKYIVDLPTVEIDGKESKFMNGVGYGIDGYCCEEGDRLRAVSDGPINYTSIAIKGLLFKFKPAAATVTVDGVTKTYKKCWLAPMMNGRCYGGGMIAAPGQDRLNKERTLTLLVWHDSGKLNTLMHFPKIFKGEHVKYTKMCDVITGYDITVEFSEPIAAQIDGETVLGVTKCHAKSYALKKEEATV